MVGVVAEAVVAVVEAVVEAVLEAGGRRLVLAFYSNFSIQFFSAPVSGFCMSLSLLFVDGTFFLSRLLFFLTRLLFGVGK